MSKVFNQYLKQLEKELIELNNQEKIFGKNQELTQAKSEIKGKISKLEQLIKKDRSKYLIQNKKGYLSANDSFNQNMEFAYIYDEDEAIRKARSLGGWLVEKS